MKKLFNTFLQDEQGQDLVEYALLLAFIALAAVTLLSGMKTSITGIFTKVSTNLATANQ
jgi:Flp pilus assembly pilin Flp